jgi:uncharacterized RDD family membrane protein YckC
MRLNEPVPFSSSDDAHAQGVQYASASLGAGPASLTKRIEAAATSACPAAVWIVLCSAAIHMGLDESMKIRIAYVPGFVVDAGTFFAVWLFPLLVNALYSTKANATYGMAHRGICFRCAHSPQIQPGKCFIRSVVGVLCLPLAPLSLVIMCVDPSKRTVADLLCGTIVVGLSLSGPSVDREGKHWRAARIEGSSEPEE